MFNKGLFNRLLFNRAISLFRDRDEITLLGELVGYRTLEGLFQPELSLEGIENLTIEQFGQLSYAKNLLGQYQIYYNLDGERIVVLTGEGAKAAVEQLAEWKTEITPPETTDKSNC